MHNILTVAGALLRAFKRNKAALFFTVLFPIVLFVIIGSLTASRQQAIDVGVIPGAQDLDGVLLRSLAKAPGIVLHIGGAESERAALADQKRALLLDLSTVPAHADLANPATIPVVASSARKGEAMAGLVLIRQALADPSIRTSPFDFALRDDGSRHVPYLVFLLPGIIGFSIMQMCVFSVAQGQLHARQSGMLKGLLLTRMTGLEFVVGTAVSRLAIALLQAGALFFAAILFFKVYPQGSLLGIVALLLLGGLVFVGIGFLISSMTNMQEAVNPTANAVMLPMFLLGGVFFPISSLPGWLQAPAHLLPLAGFVSGLRQVVTTNRLGPDYYTNLVLLAGWATVVLVAAGLLIRRRAWYTE